jgi:nitroreductase
MEGFIPEKVSEVLKLEELELTPIVMLPVGIRASDDIMYGKQKVRKPLIDMIIEMN